MFDQLAEQLKSSDSTQRRQAIVGLGKLADQRALPLLANVFRSDPDETLRELAKKAGQHIKKQTSGMSAVSAASGPTASSPSTHNTPFVPTPPVASPAFTIDPSALSDEQLNSYTPTPESDTYVPYTPAPHPASSYSSSSPFTTAEEAQPAFPYTYSETPAPAQESSAAPPKSAFAPIAPIAPIAPLPPLPPLPSAAPRASGKMPKSSLTGSSAISNEVVTLLAMLIALFIVQSFIGITARYAVRPLFSQLGQLQTVMAPPNARSSRTSAQTLRSQQALLEMQQELSRINLGEVLLEGAVTTFTAMFELAILFGVGTYMGGSGAALPFISNLLFIQIVIQILTVVGAGAILFGIMRVPPELFTSSNPSAATLSSASSSLMVIAVGFGIMALVFVGGSIWKIYAVAKNHEVGFIKGFLIVLVAGVASGVVNTMIALSSATSMEPF